MPDSNDNIGGDPEIQGMAAVAAAFTGLDRPTRTRIIQWADQRYGLGAELTTPTDIMAEFAKFTAAVNETCRRVGWITPAQLIAAMSKVADDVAASAAANVEASADADG